VKAVGRDCLRTCAANTGSTFHIKAAHLRAAVGKNPTPLPRNSERSGWQTFSLVAGISGLVVEYVVAIDVTRVRFPADAFFWSLCSYRSAFMSCHSYRMNSENGKRDGNMENLGIDPSASRMLSERSTI
jgi:hypothetical protein